MYNVRQLYWNLSAVQTTPDDEEKRTKHVVGVILVKGKQDVFGGRENKALTVVC